MEFKVSKTYSTCYSHT